MGTTKLESLAEIVNDSRLAGGRTIPVGLLVLSERWYGMVPRGYGKHCKVGLPHTLARSNTTMLVTLPC